MWFGEFFTRSIVLSFIVALFWMPVLGITLYGVKTVFDILQDEPIALVMLVVLFVQPIFVFLSILAIRGGMMALKVTDGSEIGKLFSVTWRVLRFNVPLMMLIITLFGLSVMITGLNISGNPFLDELARASSLSARFKSYFIKEAAVQFPVAVSAGWVLGICVAYAAMGVSVAAAAAMAVAKPPNHFTIWGIGAQFVNLLILSLVVLFLPFVLFIMAFGGMQLSVEYLLGLDPFLYYGIAIYLVWAYCVLAAGAALAYSLTLVADEERRAAEMAAVAGVARDRERVDLAALRKSRMHNQD